MSEEILAEHERDGDLSRSGAGYFCNVCLVPLGQLPLPHLQGTNHNNAIFLLTLSQPSKYRVRYRDIPERIRTALEGGEIVTKEKKVICTICDVQLSREKTVNDHLLSSIHVTRIASRTPPAASSQPFSPRGAAQSPLWPPIVPHESSSQPFSPRGAAQSPLWPPIVPHESSSQPFSPRGAAQSPRWPPIVPHESSSQPFSPRGAARSPFSSSLVPDESSLGQEAPSTTVERTDFTVAQALRNGNIKMVQIDGIDGFVCNVCGNSNIITGDTPMRQHLLGKTHLKNARKHELRLQQPNGELALLQPLSTPSRNVDQFPVQQPSFADQHQLPYHHLNPTTSPQLEFNNQPYSRHHQNKSHSQQREFNYQQNPPHQQNLYQGQVSNQQQYNIVNAFSSINISVTVDDSKTPPPTYKHQHFPPPSTSANPFRTDPKSRSGRGQPTIPYKIESSSRGIVVVFNYYFEGQGKNQRVGAAADYQNLNSVFKKMDYEVWPENIDLTKQETLDKLDVVCSSQRLAKVDSLIIFFLSHGGNTPDEFKTVEGGVISVEEIIYTKFTDANCPQLQLKPKLFFFNFCRGETEQLQSDFWKPNCSSAIAPKDVAVVQAALPYFLAKRHRRKGTVFVDCICEILHEFAGSLDLHDIVQNTSKLMQERHGTTASILNIDFGKFNFL